MLVIQHPLHGSIDLFVPEQNHICFFFCSLPILVNQVRCNFCTYGTFTYSATSSIVYELFVFCNLLTTLMMSICLIKKLRCECFQPRVGR